MNLPRLKATIFAELDANGVESMRDIPPDFSLTPSQRRVVEAVVSGQEFISDELPEALTALGPPASYLFSPAIPLYAGTRPYQRIPFQWSVHHDNGAGEVRHFEFLADGGPDPRREFAETLIEAINRTTGRQRRDVMTDRTPVHDLQQALAEARLRAVEELAAKSGTLPADDLQRLATLQAALQR
jgi:Domain of unknown function(DUF2779)